MRHDDIYIAGTGSYFPKAVPVDDAIVSGRYDEVARRASGQRWVTIAGDGDSQPEMAVRAGRSALARSSHEAGSVGLLLHAVAVYSGLDGWNSASYLQNEILDGAGIAFEVRQVSNGAVGAVELAVPFLRAPGGPDAALITAAERFAEPAWDRWRADAGLVFGDGASAMLLSTRSGFARLLSSATESAAELEGLHRGDAPFLPCPDPAAYPLDLHSRAMEFTDRMELEEIREIGRRGLRRAAERAATDAGMAVGDASVYVVPNFGAALLRSQVLDPLGVPLERTTHSWGAEIGHVGASDQFGALNHLVEQKQVAPGDRVMVIGVGGGFNWTCLVLEITGLPAW
ncbi:ketoacyl-ACP synthase III family protein [Antribacter sp. KLBMP9083]|uniref:Ketoacyl-ACP synthase III family protein n=1 Tax=Antribacter soli TaxID=2910976 RepID=A0AA41QIG8_9MICO|nr:ketoacyl-ACP synthase III family protein [Antribacter soli]MCF4123365.1 ketoacyl-ACP synthase III family protein [Antribacter soli]